MGGYRSLLESNEFAMNTASRKLSTPRLTHKIGSGTIYVDGQPIGQTMEVSFICEDGMRNTERGRKIHGKRTSKCISYTRFLRG